MSDLIQLSELYGKEIISNTGARLGTVQDIVLDFSEGRIASMLLVKSEALIRSEHTSREFAKNSVRYERVRNVDETIIVSSEMAKR